MFPHALRLVLAQASVSVLPVLLFLFALELIDTYKLLTLGRVLAIGGRGLRRGGGLLRAQHRGLRVGNRFTGAYGRDRARRCLKKLRKRCMWPGCCGRIA